MRSLINRAREALFGFFRTLRKQIRSSLKSQQQSVKTLQQRIVQFPRDARPFTNALFQTQIELDSKLMQVVAMDAPYQKKN